MKIERVFLVILCGLILPVLVLADCSDTYQRTPNGFTISTPVNFYAERQTIFYPFWGIAVWKGGGQNDLVAVECISNTIPSHVFTFNLPVGTYTSVYQNADFTLELCESNNSDGVYRCEGDSGEPIFEVASPPVAQKILTIPPEFSTNVLAYVGQLFTDLAPVFYLVVGLYVAFWVASKVIALARGGFRPRKTN